MALPTFPRHLTLTPEERSKAGLADTGSTAGLSRVRRLKLYEFTVTYSDGTEGLCQYERLGPAWHRFEYRYGDSSDSSDGSSGSEGNHSTPLPHQYRNRPLGNTPGEIEEAGRQMAEAAFSAAIERERTNHFRRASPPSGTTPDPKLFQFSAKRAKEVGGRYALCIRLGAKLIPVDPQLYLTLAEANTAWQERPEAERATLVVGCACRWSRRWERPRFNPLNLGP